ncbi:hypothetical protein A9Q99_23450 [Gammaproteobacteria bacterium 45_16_T64]|nr:hypothetical protein A9Q99_23450 [Gammaproteobacteria bacterium 45_16_T64]
MKNGNQLARSAFLRGVLPLLALVPSMAAQALTLGEEEVPTNEAAVIEEVQEFILGTLSPAAGTETLAKRDFHGKSHGCASAEFTVQENLPIELQKGLFAQPGTYPTWLRFSNAGNLPDGLPDIRAVAIKILGVEGEQALGDNNTQDFIMANHPVFFLRDAQGFLDIGVPLFSDGSLPNGFEHEKAILGASVGVIDNVLNENYWTQIPSQFSVGNAAKFKMQACDSNSTNSTSALNGDRLSIALSESLQSADQCFDFQVQLQTDATTMPIEDATIEWSESASPYVTVATVTIPMQEPNSEHRSALCENMSFTPWHSLEVHRPLGGIARIRKVIYAVASDFRRDKNGVSTTEPELDALMTDVSVTSVGGKNNGKYQEGEIESIVTVTNEGSETASATLLTMILPSETPLVNSISDCTEANNVLRCDLGDLAPGASISKTVLVSSTSSSAKYDFFNRVSSATEDNDLSNNETSNRYGGSFGIGSLFALLLIAGRRFSRK